MRTTCIFSAVMALALAGLLPGQRGPARPGRMMRPGIPREAAGTQSERRPRIADNLFPVDRWNGMNADERERALAKLPPERQQKIRDQVARFNSLPEPEQQRLRERYRRLQQMPPERREAVRRELRQFSEMPVDRRRALVREMRQLRMMSDAERRSRMASEDFMGRYNTDERLMLADLTDYISPGPARPPEAGGPRKD